MKVNIEQTRKHWGEHFDDVIETLKADKEKILDIIMDKCSDITVSIPFNIGEVPHYEVDYVKVAVNIERVMKKECDKN